MIPKAQLNPIEVPLLEIDGDATHINFDPSEANLGASGIRGVAIYTYVVLLYIHTWCCYIYIRGVAIYTKEDLC